MRGMISNYVSTGYKYTGGAPGAGRGGREWCRTSCIMYQWVSSAKLLRTNARSQDDAIIIRGGGTAVYHILYTRALTYLHKCERIAIHQWQVR